MSLSIESDPDHKRLAWPRLVYDDIHSERIRAHKKHGAKGNSRENANWTDNEWLPILTEELGEVAHELTYDVSRNKTALRKELVQVAAMAAAWIEAIDASNEEFNRLVS